MNNSKERWKYIPGYHHTYQVSSHGRIRTISHLEAYHYENGHKIIIRRVPSRIRKQHTNKDGYLVICLLLNGHKKSFSVHRLVAQAFIPNPHNLPEVNHKDENPQNNKIENLEWCTRKYNCNYGNRTLKMYLHDIESRSNHLDKKLLPSHDIRAIKIIASLIKKLHCLN